MEYPSLLLLLVLVASVFSVRSECPPEEDIYPCECIVDRRMDDTRVACENSRTSLNDLKSVLSYFSKEEEIFSIVLKNLNLGTIPSNIFEGIAVKEMSITNCEIDFENGKPPLKGLEDSLQVLTIKSSLTQKNFQHLKLGHLKELEKLQLSDNKITELHHDMLDDEMPNLFSFVLNNNLIENIGDNAFENLTNVKYFTLLGNKLGALRRNMIPTSATQLSQLWLGNNGIEELSDDLFTSSMPSLEIVSLYKNKIKTVKRNTWETILKKQVVSVSLNENPLQCDSEMEWLLDLKVPYNILGTCAGPEGKEGLSLKEFLRKGTNN